MATAPTQRAMAAGPGEASEEAPAEAPAEAPGEAPQEAPGPSPPRRMDAASATEARESRSMPCATRSLTRIFAPERPRTGRRGATKARALAAKDQTPSSEREAALALSTMLDAGSLPAEAAATEPTGSEAKARAVKKLLSAPPLLSEVHWPLTRAASRTFLFIADSALISSITLRRAALAGPVAPKTGGLGALRKYASSSAADAI